MASVALKSFVGLRQTSPENHHSSIATLSKPISTNQIHYRRLNVVAGKSSPKITGRNLRVAVIGGGPAGGAAAETLAKGGIETILIERKMDNAKPCGGAIPLCMVGEFDLPLDIIDRRVTKMKMISPSNVAVDIGRTLKPHEYIGMVRREVLDAYLRDRAAAAGATVINGLFFKMDKPTDKYAPYVLHYNAYDGKAGSAGKRETIEVDAVIGADGANSRVAKSIDAGDYEYAIAFQERIKIPADKMQYYEDLAEMYVGDDVSPDFYGWVFPKCDHVAVGTGTVTHKPDIKKFQLATRLRARDKILGGKIIRVEAHPIPEHPRPRRLAERVALVGDAAGYVTKCSGEGIYFAAKSGRMCAEAIVEGSENGKRMVDEADLRKYLEKWDKTYWPTYKVLDILQKVFYRSNPAREAFVEMCADEYVQKMTFDSYLYKKVAPGNPLEDLKLAVNTIGSLVRANALRFREPPVRVINTALSVMAYEYPTEKLSVYVSDDGGSQLTLFAFMEAAKFAKHWLPYCRKYDIMDRSPEVYFGSDSFFFPEAYQIKVMYETMKAKIEKVVDSGTVSPDLITDERWLKALDKWTPTFTPQNHPAVVEVLLESNEDKDITDHPLPNLIYVSREKNKSVHHNFKGGALNSVIRVSATLTDAPIFLVLDCDMYSNNPKTALYTLCHFLDPKVDPNLALVQFPQCFHDINKVDTYGAEHLPEIRTIPMGMDGICGTMFIGSGGFFKRQALLGSPASIGPSDIKQAKTHCLGNKSMKSDDILAVAHRVAGCQYEENTKWGLEMGFRYGSLVEDIYTSFRLQCQGWTSVFCDPERPSFLGNSPMALSDLLLQSKRWFVGFLEMVTSKHNPITYGFKYMNPIHALCYAHYNFRPFWAIPIVIYAFLPQLALLNSYSIFPKVSDTWFPLYAFLFLGAYGKSLFEFLVAGGTFVKWRNSTRMWLALGCSSYPFSMVDWVLKSLGLSTIEFNVTSKVLDDELKKRYEAGLFEFGVESPLFLTISIAAVVNLLAFLMGTIQVLKNGGFEELFAQLFIAGFGVINSWPIYEAMLLRSDKGKMPMMTTLKALGVASVVYFVSSLAF